MTARDQARLGDRRLSERERERALAIEAAATEPRLGELLLAARERKGVDLYRAERDTKIRAKYLAALERSDFKDLPGAVYTKGFLRNYALYLGLNPDVVLERWKEEGGSTRPVERVVIAPRPLEAPRSGPTFSKGVFVAALLTLAILAFAGYITLQLLRFAQPPTLSVNQPAVNPVAAETQVFQLDGRSDPNATIEIKGPGQQVHRFAAGADGNWSREVNVNKGRNDFEIVATDPVTSKPSAPLSVIVQVPIPQGPEAPTLEVASPNDGTAFTNGAIPISGQTNGRRVTVTAQAEPSVTAPTPSVVPSPSSSPAAPLAPSAKDITVAEDGSFSDSYQLAPGRWTLTITATGAQDKTTTEQRTISVAFTGVNLVVDIRNNRAWVKVWVDGQVAEGFEAGRTLAPGTSVEFNARSTIEVRSGSSGSTFFTLNGTPLGALGRSGIPETWLFAPPQPPEQTGRTR